jgi:hypothetical protein
VGNQIEDAQGNPWVLHGVNRSGTEYKCIQGGGIFDGPSDEASVQTITTWKGVNAVRVPLNESCWLGINGAPPAYSGCAYKNAIVQYVGLLHKYGLVPILDLHWVGPGTLSANEQFPMPDLDHAPAFWTDVATTFLTDEGVVFDPYNEPFPDSNQDTPAAWSCWRDGCSATQMWGKNAGTTYMAVGLQGLVTAIRDTGSKNLIVLGGVQWSNTLTQWLANEPVDGVADGGAGAVDGGPAPGSNIAAAWHVYNNNPCRDATCWNAAPATVAANVPLIATEIGENDCDSTFVDPLMQWLDGHGVHGVGYLAWSWDHYGPCMPWTSNSSQGNPYNLIGDYSTGAPNGGATVDGGTATYAQTVHDHIAAWK